MRTAPAGALLARPPTIQLREGRWVLADLEGKGRRIRTVAVPGWVKQGINAWMTAATIARVRQLPAMLGAQTSKYIAAGIREVVQDDFRQPVEKAIERPIRSIEVAAYHAREAVEQIKREVRFQNWTVFALILAVGMALGGGAASFFFARQVATLNDRFDYLQHLLLAPPPASADTHVPPPKSTGKKPGQH